MVVSDNWLFDPRYPGEDFDKPDSVVQLINSALPPFSHGRDAPAYIQIDHRNKFWHYSARISPTCGKWMNQPILSDLWQHTPKNAPAPIATLCLNDPDTRKRLCFFCFFAQISFTCSLIQYRPLTFNRWYVYPTWAYVMGWMMALSSILLVPGWALYKLTTVTGTLSQVGQVHQWTRNVKEWFLFYETERTFSTVWLYTCIWFWHVSVQCLCLFVSVSTTCAGLSHLTAHWP